MSKKKVLTADDLVIGAKYVPHQKTGGYSLRGLKDSAAWAAATNYNQAYLYYTGIYDGKHCFSAKALSASAIYSGADVGIGDYFNPEDMTPYQEKPAIETTPYEKLFKLYDLKVGDTVKITHKVPSLNLGWNNSWIAESMDQCIGKTATVTGLDPATDGVQISINSFRFPIQCMEVVTRKANELVDFSSLSLTVAELTAAVGIDTANQILKLIKKSKTKK